MNHSTFEQNKEVKVKQRCIGCEIFLVLLINGHFQPVEEPESSILPRTRIPNYFWNCTGHKYREKKSSSLLVVFQKCAQVALSGWSKRMKASSSAFLPHSPSTSFVLLRDQVPSPPSGMDRVLYRCTFFSASFKQCSLSRDPIWSHPIVLFPQMHGFENDRKKLFFDVCFFLFQ